MNHILRLSAIIRKNMRNILRSKSSSAAILLGPLLIILIVGVVFNSSGDPVIGIVSSDSSAPYEQSLADSFIILEYTSSDACSQDVRRGVINGCVVFLPGRASLIVDPTQSAVYYPLLEKITSRLDAQTGLIREGLSEEVLSALSTARVNLYSDASVSKNISASLTSLQRDLAVLRDSSGSVFTSISLVSPQRFLSLVDSVVDAQNEYRSLAFSLHSAFDELASSQGDNSSREVANEFLSSLQRVDNGSIDDLRSIAVSLERTAQSVSEIEFRQQELYTQANILGASLSSTRVLVDALQSSLEETQSVLFVNISVSELSDPLLTVVEPVSVPDDISTLFPSFLVLLIMFTSLLLASQLVISERSSRAYFRNFITPTPDWLFVLSMYATTLLVVLIQVILLSVVSSFFISFSLSEHLFTTSILLFSIITFFSFLGVLMGYLFNTRESVLLSAITVSAILLLVSDVVLPIHSLPGLIEFFVQANPFVLSNQLLIGALVFQFSLSELIAYLFVLWLYAIMLFALIMIVQRVARVQYFESRKTALRVSSFLQEGEVPEGRELLVFGKSINSKKSLISLLESISDDAYEQFADHSRNVFADWIRDVYKDDQLSRALRNKSRKGAISTLKQQL